MPKTNVICVVPAKNEAWILRNLIECALAWADHIIIGDHNSSDDSASIAKSYKSKVKVIPINDQSLDRGNRRKILIDEARKIPGRRLIFTIDADEMISANWVNSSEWDLMLNAQPGTQFDFDWVELFPGVEQCDIFYQSAAFLDDDTEYVNRGTEIHESRMPQTKRVVKLNDIKLLHYTYIDLERFLSKHRWYKCTEYIELGKRPWALCIMYHDTKIKSYDAPVVSVKPEWIKDYEWLDKYRLNGGIAEECYFYDEEVLNYFDRYGAKKFSKLNIWDTDWNRKAQLIGRHGDYSDPRSRYEVWIHKYIENHREELKMKQTIPLKAVRLFGKTVLRALGW